MFLPIDVPAWLLPTVVVVAIASWGCTALVLRELTRRAILDRPNHRSSHSVPTPRGGGWGVMIAVLAGAAFLVGRPGTEGLAPVLAAVLGLMALSWLDDLKDLPARVRFAAQWLAVVVGLAMLPSDGRVFQGLLPFWLDRAVAALAWVWFINLFNFMDGIDGITGTEMAVLGLGLTVTWILGGERGAIVLLPAILAAAGLGFLGLNWHPARVFMGDVGSVPAGYLFGWLLLLAASSGYWVAALVLPAYYLADATLTLVRRALRREQVWKAHREHLYQQAVRRGWRHSEVVVRIAAAGLVLCGCAAGSVRLGPVMLVPATLATLGLLSWLARSSPQVALEAAPEATPAVAPAVAPKVAP